MELRATAKGLEEGGREGKKKKKKKKKERKRLERKRRMMVSAMEYGQRHDQYARNY
jgi:hypothetical protein